jgi:hypothetical protein
MGEYVKTIRDAVRSVRSFARSRERGDPSGRRCTATVKVEWQIVLKSMALVTTLIFLIVNNLHSHSLEDAREHALPGQAARLSMKFGGRLRELLKMRFPE